MTTQTQQPANIQIGLGAQYIKDFSFENPSAPQIFTELQQQPQIAMDVNVQSRTVADAMFEATLKIRLESKIGAKTAFIVELAYAGLFTLPEMPEEQMKLFLFVEAPRMMFPYSRAIITSALRDGGFPHVTLQPIDFYSLYMSQRSAAAQHTVGAA